MTPMQMLVIVGTIMFIKGMNDAVAQVLGVILLLIAFLLWIFV